MNDDHDTRIKELKLQFAHATANKDAITNEIEHLEEEVEKFEKGTRSNPSAEEGIDRLKSKAKQLKKETENRESDLKASEEKARGELRTLHAQCIDLETRLSLSKENMRNAPTNEKSSAVQKDVERLKQSIYQIESQVADVKGECAALQQAIQETLNHPALAMERVGLDNYVNEAMYILQSPQ